MGKSQQILIGFALALMATSSAQAADRVSEQPMELRGSADGGYGDGTVDDELGFAFSIRHWYSQGTQELVSAPYSRTLNDRVHTIEIAGRADDERSGDFVKGTFGYSVKRSDGTLTSSGTSPYGPDLTFDAPYQGGTLTYGSIDYGFFKFDIFDSLTNTATWFIGYQNWNESPDIDSSGPTGQTFRTDLQIDAVRTGIAARFVLSDRFDITLDAALVPYAEITDNNSCTCSSLYSATSTLKTKGWGGEIDAMLGYQISDDLVIRTGLRLWQLSTYDGTATTTYTQTAGGATTTASANINSFDIRRWGTLVELIYKF